MRHAARRASQRESYAWVAGLLLLVGLCYVALKVSPDLFASDRFPDQPCDPKQGTYKDCLDGVRAQAEDRRGVTTATLALYAAALGAFGAVYTARTFAQNRATAQRSHELD